MAAQDPAPGTPPNYQPGKPPRDSDDASERLARMLLSGANPEPTSAPEPIAQPEATPVQPEAEPEPEPEEEQPAILAFDTTTSRPLPAPPVGASAGHTRGSRLDPQELRQTITPPLLVLGTLLLGTAVACFLISDDYVLGSLPRYVPVLGGLVGLVLLAAGAANVILTTRPVTRMDTQTAGRTR